MNIPDHISESLVTIFGVKNNLIICQLSVAAADPGWKNPDPGWKNPDPG